MLGRLIHLGGCVVVVVDRAVDVLDRNDCDDGGGGMRVRSEQGGKEEEDKDLTRGWDCEVMVDGYVDNVGDGRGRYFPHLTSVSFPCAR